MSDFDLYKENIQPRRRGHSAQELSNLSKLSDPSFREERTKQEAQWEIELRKDGSIDTWYRYISWAEQNLYTQLQLNELRQKTLAKFIHAEQDKSIKNDPRLFSIFLQSTDDSRNWRDMFSFARSKGFFLGLATFWCHWAERFELDQMVKDADRVLAEGEQILRSSPEEVHKLEKWRTTFDVRIASGVSIQAAPEPPPRPRTERRGLSVITAKKSEKAEKSKKRQKGLAIFHDSDEPDHVAGLHGDWNAKSIPKNRPRQTEKENKTQPGKWTEKSSSRSVKTHPVITRPRVDIFVTENLDIPAPDKAVSKAVLRETKTSRRDAFMEMISNENANGKEKPMYRKTEVYLGLKEMSFEELRAQKWEKYRNTLHNRNAKTPVRESLRDHEGQFIERPMAKIEDDAEDSFFETAETQPDDDLVCGVLPDTPVQNKKKPSKLKIFQD